MFEVALQEYVLSWGEKNSDFIMSHAYFDKFEPLKHLCVELANTLIISELNTTAGNLSIKDVAEKLKIPLIG